MAFFIRRPNRSGIGDQIVNHWSENFMLAQMIPGGIFIHSGFNRSMGHSPEVDWEKWLGFGRPFLDYEDMKSLVGSKLRWHKVPHIDCSQNDNFEDLLAFLTERNHRFSAFVFETGYFNIPLDQSRVMPDVYSRLFWKNRSRYLSHNSDSFQIAIHIRRGDVGPKSIRYMPDSYYHNALSAISDIFSESKHLNVKAVIFSDGTEDEVEQFRHYFPGVELVTGGDPRGVLIQMASSDLLISSQSFFSVFAGKVSSGYVLFPFDLDLPGSRLYIPKDDPRWLSCNKKGVLGDAAKATLSAIVKKT